MLITIIIIILGNENLVLHRNEEGHSFAYEYLKGRIRPFSSPPREKCGRKTHLRDDNGSSRRRRYNAADMIM